MINSQHSNGNYSKGRGIFVGFRAPVYVTEYGIRSLAIEGGYGNLGTIEGEDNLGDPYSLRMGIVQLGLRGTGMLTTHISAFAKPSIARINVDSTELGKDINVDGQLAAGLEWHLPKGLAFNLTYSQITDDVTSVLLGMSIR